MTNPNPLTVALPEIVFIASKLLAKARGISLEELVASVLAKEIRASRKEIDTFTVEELAGEELGKLVERIRREDGGGA